MRQAMVMMGMNALLRTISVFSSRLGKAPLRMSLPNMELKVRIMEFIVDTAAAMMLRVTTSASAGGTRERTAAMALSAVSSPGFRTAAENPR